VTVKVPVTGGERAAGNSPFTVMPECPENKERTRLCFPHIRHLVPTGDGESVGDGEGTGGDGEGVTPAVTSTVTPTVTSTVTPAVC